jgi:hypothetical protein
MTRNGISDWMGEPPEGIIVTISGQLLKERGYKNWLKDFLNAMGNPDMVYYLRQGNQPKREVLYVYLCIGGQIRFRANYVMSHGPGAMKFNNGSVLVGHAWVILAGPVVRPSERIPMKGFQGFRYTHKLF